MGIGQLENRFLWAIAQADFLYVYIQDDYVGGSTALEIGSARTHKAIYTSQPIAFELAESDLERTAFLEQHLIVAGVAEAVRIECSWQD